MSNPTRLTYIAIGLAAVALVVAVVAVAKPAPSTAAAPPTSHNATAVKVAFTPVGPTLNLSTWDWARVGVLSVSGGDALVRFALEGEVVSGTAYVKLVDRATGEVAAVEQLGTWVAVRAGTYDVYVRAILTSTTARLRVESYA